MLTDGGLCALILVWGWSQLTLPAVEILGENPYGGRIRIERLFWNERSVAVIGRIYNDKHSSIPTATRGFPCDRLVLTGREYDYVPGALWTTNSSRIDGSQNEVASNTLFPPEWKRLAGVEDNRIRLWNKDHPTVKMVRRSDLNWLRQNLRSQIQFAQLLPDLFKERGRVAAWVMTRLYSGPNYWTAIRDHHSEAFADALNLCCPRDEHDKLAPIVYWSAGKEYSNSRELLILSPTTVKRTSIKLTTTGLVLENFGTFAWPSDPEWWLVSKAHTDSES